MVESARKDAEDWVSVLAELLHQWPTERTLTLRPSQSVGDDVGFAEQHVRNAVNELTHIGAYRRCDSFKYSLSQPRISSVEPMRME